MTRYATLFTILWRHFDVLYLRRFEADSFFQKSGHISKTNSFITIVFGVFWLKFVCDFKKNENHCRPKFRKFHRTCQGCLQSISSDRMGGIGSLWTRQSRRMPTTRPCQHRTTHDPPEPGKLQPKYGHPGCPARLRKPRWSGWQT